MGSNERKMYQNSNKGSLESWLCPLADVSCPECGGSNSPGISQVILRGLFALLLRLDPARDDTAYLKRERQSFSSGENKVIFLEVAALICLRYYNVALPSEKHL